jgi:transposase
MIRRVLTPPQRQQLRRLRQQADDARTYRRAVALLAIDDGAAVATTARALGISRQIVHRWLAVVRRTRDATAAVAPRARPGRRSRWSPQLRTALAAALRRAPDALGYRAVEWTVPLLLEHLAARAGVRLSDDTLRRELQRAGWVWKRPRYVLAPDPAAGEKSAASAVASANLDAASSC